MKKQLLLLASCIPCLSSFAQEDIFVVTDEEEPVVTVIVGDKNSASDAETELRKNSPSRINDQGLPRFAIIGNENKFYLGIGAQFLGEAVFDFGATNPSVVDFIPSSLTPAAPGCGGAFNFSAVTSGFFINAVALPGTENRIGFFLKGTTSGGDNKYGFHLSHVYVNFRNFTAGYTNGLFTDGGAIPFTIDDQGPNGAACYKTFTFNYVGNITKDFTAAIGIEQPAPDLTTGNNTAEVTQRVPSVPVYLQYGWGDDSHARLSGVFRPMQYRNLVEVKNRTQMGWGVQFSGVTALVPSVKLYWSAVYGRGIGTYLQDDQDLHLDGAPSLDEPGRCKLIRNFGVTGGMSWRITPHLNFSAVYSHLVNSRPDGVTPLSDKYRYGDYAAANLVYAFNKIISTGIEYDYGHRKSFDGTSLHTNRIQAQLAISF